MEERIYMILCFLYIFIHDTHILYKVNIKKATGVTNCLLLTFNRHLLTVKGIEPRNFNPLTAQDNQSGALPGVELSRNFDAALMDLIG